MIRFGIDQFLFMAESEGYDDIVDTETAKINAIIRELKELAEKQKNRFIKIADILSIAEKHGINKLDDYNYSKIIESARIYPQL